MEWERTEETEGAWNGKPTKVVAFRLVDKRDGTLAMVLPTPDGKWAAWKYPGAGCFTYKGVHPTLRAAQQAVEMIDRGESAR